MGAAHPLYLEMIDFIASGTTPEAVVQYRPSAQAQQRLEELLAAAEDGQLTPEQQAELNHFLELEHILRMAKARALQILARGQ
jgi:hypothetical protein